MQGHGHPTSRPPSSEFLGGPAVKNSCFHCRGHRFDTRLGTSDPSKVWSKILGVEKEHLTDPAPQTLSERHVGGRVGRGGLRGGSGHSRSDHFNPPSGQIFTGLGVN